MITLHIEHKGPAVSEAVREAILTACQDGGLLEGGLQIGYSVIEPGQLFMLWTAPLSVPVAHIFPPREIENAEGAKQMVSRFLRLWRSRTHATLAPGFMQVHIATRRTVSG